MEEKGKTGNLIVGSAIIKSICKIYSPRIQCDLHIQPNEIVLKMSIWDLSSNCIDFNTEPRPDFYEPAIKLLSSLYVLREW